MEKKDQFSEHISKLSAAVENQPKARLPGSKKKPIKGYRN